jgi:hypothetical protein
MRLRDSAWPGSVAGDLLIYLQQTRASGIKPSINKALALVVCSLKGATNARRKPRGRSSRYIRKQWEEFKPVAHLWAAYRAILFANLQGKNQPEMSTDEGLPLFLALAEWFAEEGLSIYPHSRRQPALDSSELWRVPAALRSQWPLLEVEQAPLPEWAVEALRRQYKGLRS